MSHTKMSLSYRFFVGKKRISTAVTTKKGDFLQVYPEKKTFLSESAWREHWSYFNKARVESTLTLSPKDDKKTVEVVKEDDWTFSSSKHFTAPPGTYYIGDLCYVLSDNVYDTIFGGLGGYDAGLYTKKNSNDFFLVASTTYGDGLYTSSDQKQFAVDAGIIGIAPMSLVSKNDGGGQFYTFDKPVKCKFRGGRFSFTSGHNEIVIDTSGDDEE
jgi:hypothetical protein